MRRHLMRALMGALRFDAPDTAGLRDLSDSDWMELLDYLDRQHMTLALAGRCRQLLPDWVRERTDRDIAGNMSRLQRRREAYREIAAALERKGIEHAVLKGLSHDVSLRPQGDIDLLCTPETAQAAQQTVIALGYEPVTQDGEFLADHLALLIRRTAWRWHGDYYDPEQPVSVEIHFRFWDPATERIDIPDVDRFWPRRQSVSVNGVPLVALDPSDRLIYASLHALRHLLRGDLLMWHVYELGLLLRRLPAWGHNYSDTLRQSAAIPFRLAHEWFGCALPEMPEFPPQVERWFDLYGQAPIRAKSELWLHTSLISSRADVLRVARRKLLPLQKRRMLDLDRKPGFARLHNHWSFLARRLVFHARTFPLAVAQGLRWFSYCRLATCGRLSIGLFGQRSQRTPIGGFTIRRSLPACPTEQHSGNPKVVGCLWGRRPRLRPTPWSGCWGISQVRTSRPGGRLQTRGSAPIGSSQGAEKFNSSSTLGPAFVTFLGAQTLFNIGMTIFYFLYNLYLLKLGFHEDFVGLIAGATTTGSIVGTIPAGFVTSRFGLKAALIFAFTTAPLLCALRASTLNHDVLLATAFLSGFALSIYAVALTPTTAQLVTEKSRARAFSLVCSLGIGIGIVGSLAGGTLPDWVGGIRPALLAACAIAALGALAALRLPLPAPDVQTRNAYPRDPIIYRYLAALALWSLATGALNPFFNVYFATQLKAPIHSIGLIFSASQFTQTLAVLAAPLVLRHFGMPAGIMAMQIATGVSLVLLATTPPLVGAAALYASYMACQYMSEPGMFTFLMDRAKPHERGGAAALNMLVLFAGQAIAAAISGVALHRFGYPTVLTIAALLAVVAGLSFRAALPRETPALLERSAAT